MEPISPIYTADLSPPLHQALVDLLRDLGHDDWHRPTVAGTWQVCDVAAHLLDIDLRRLSVNRDRHLPAPPVQIENHGQLIRFLNGLNAEWVAAARRLSPRVLVELLAFAGPLVSALMRELPPHERSVFSVAWAGESESENWFDIGRDFTERWHHQMQIRDAVGAPLLLERRWLRPLLDLSFRALPVAYRDLRAADGTMVALRIDGIDDDAWSIVRRREGWVLYRGMTREAAATVTLEPDVAWRLLFNAISEADARHVRAWKETFLSPMRCSRHGR